MPIYDDVLYDADAAAAIEVLCEADPQGLSNPAWTLARLELRHASLMDTAVVHFVARIQELTGQNLANAA